MGRLTLVVAIDAHNGIGIDNKLPWHLPEDLAHFKRVTLGRPIVMGRKTFESIGRALPGRRNIVVTRNAAWSHAGVECAGSLEAAIALLDGEGASIIGGAQIFAEAIGLADDMIVTEIAQVFECDTFFPTIDRSVWHETARENAREVAHSPHPAGDSACDYAFVTYQRI